MDWHNLPLAPGHQITVDRFVNACQADKRVVAAFVGGSYGRGTADAYSDLDRYLITFCSLEPVNLLQAGLKTVEIYRELAPILAEQYGLPYPAGLERVMFRRLEALRAQLS